MGLFSSDTSAKQIDLNLVSSLHQPYSLSIDATISSCLLPTHLQRSAQSAAASFIFRANDKGSKHTADCAARGKHFFAAVGDVLGGLGPDAFNSWLKGAHWAFAP